MAARDLFKQIVGLLAEVGHEVAILFTDPNAQADLMARAGRLPAALPANVDPGTAEAFATLRDRASTDGPIGLELLDELSSAMTGLVALIESAVQPPSVDGAWNLLANLLDIVALDRFRKTNPGFVALLKALHVLSNERFLFSDLIRAGDHWGAYVLGNPADDEEMADNLALIFGTGLAVAGFFIPPEDDTGKNWRIDMLFGWDPDPATPAPEAQRALQRMATMRFTHRDKSGAKAIDEHAGFTIVVVPPASGGWGVYLALDVGGGLRFPIGSALEMAFEADSPAAIQAFFGNPSFLDSDLSQSSVKVQLRRKASTADHMTIGDDEGIHLEIGNFAAGFVLADPMRFSVAIDDGALVIPKSDFGFMGSLMPQDGVKFSFSFELMVDTKGKLSISGGAGMTVTLPVNKSVSILKVRAITLAFAVEASHDDGPTTADASLSAVVGFDLAFGSVLKFTIDGIGAKVAWTLPSPPQAPGSTLPIVHGNLGAYGDIGLDFVPPRGVGIEINAGPVKGGGFLFFDPAHRSYGGVLDIEFTILDLGIQVKAAGLLRETDAGWDFIVILSAQLTPAPGVFGVTLSGIGGMFGDNVGVDVDKLRAGVRDGAMARLMFPDDPVANAPAIIATMVAVFPDRPGGMVIGPMLQLGFGRPKPIVTLSVAVVITKPSPANLLILGSLRVGVPDPKLALVNIEADFLGVIDPQAPAVAFNASLVNSRIATYPMTGDLVLKAGEPGFLLAVGGFNPRFTPPADFGTLRRIAIDISANPITKIHAEAYVAISSNTFQLGVHAALDIDAGVASVHGWADFDALVQWEPTFHFSVELGVGLELRVSGHSFAGISADLLVEGPGHWHVKGEASIHILFFTVHAKFDRSWGGGGDRVSSTSVDVSALVAQALSAPGALSAEAPKNGSIVTLRDVSRPGISLHPYGQATLRQQAVPIGIPVTRVGRDHAAGGSATVTLAPIAGAPGPEPTTGEFAAAQFIDLTDDQKLSRPSFENYQDGVAFGAGPGPLPPDCTATAAYETITIPELPPQRRAGLDPRLFGHALALGPVARSGLHVATLNDGPRQPVTLAPPGYRVVAAGTLAPASATVFPTSAAAHAFAAGLAGGPQVLVVGAHEMVA